VENCDMHASQIHTNDVYEETWNIQFQIFIYIFI